MSTARHGRLRARLAAERARWRVRLERFSLRFHVLLIVIATCGFAALVSRALLAAGIEQMGLRYGLVVLASYAAFCALVRLWIAIMQRLHAPRAARAERKADRDGPWDLPDPLPSLRGGSADGSAWHAGVGGDFAGGGASVEFDPPAASFAASDTSAASVAAPDAPPSGTASSAGLDFGDTLDVEGFVLLAVLALLALLAGAVLVVLWIGPGMLVEAALASFVASGLVRRSIFEVDESWLGVVFSKTWWIAALVLATAVLAGGYIGRHAPGVHTAGEAIRWVMRDS